MPRLYCQTCAAWVSASENGDCEVSPLHQVLDTRRYRIVRFYRDAAIRRRVILSGLTLEQAQAHCSNPETSSSTATGVVARRMVLTVEYGPGGRLGDRGASDVNKCNACGHKESKRA